MTIKRYDKIEILLRNKNNQNINNITHEKSAYKLKGNYLIILDNFTFEADIREATYVSHVYDLALVKSYKVTNNK